MSAFIDERKGDFGVELICRTLDVSVSGYYQRATGERSARAVEDERLVAEIRRVHKANYECYGARRVWKQLLREEIEVSMSLLGARRLGELSQDLVTRV